MFYGHPCGALYNLAYSVSVLCFSPTMCFCLPEEVDMSVKFDPDEKAQRKAYKRIENGFGNC